MSEREKGTAASMMRGAWREREERREKSFW